MVVETKIMCQQNVPVEYFPRGINVHEVEDVVAVSQSISPKSFDRNRPLESVSAAALSSSQEVSFDVLLFWII